MHKIESPPFYHLFDIPALFVLAPKGLGLSSKFATSTLLSCVVIHSVPLQAHQSLFLYDTCVSQWLTKKKQDVFHLGIIVGAATLCRCCPHMSGAW